MIFVVNVILMLLTCPNYAFLGTSTFASCCKPTSFASGTSHWQFSGAAFYTPPTGNKCKSKSRFCCYTTAKCTNRLYCDSSIVVIIYLLFTWFGLYRFSGSWVWFNATWLWLVQIKSTQTWKLGLNKVSIALLFKQFELTYDCVKPMQVIVM